MSRKGRTQQMRRPGPSAGSPAANGGAQGMNPALHAMLQQTMAKAVGAGLSEVMQRIEMMMEALNEVTVLCNTLAVILFENKLATPESLQQKMKETREDMARLEAYQREMDLAESRRVSEEKRAQASDAQPAQAPHAAGAGGPEGVGDPGQAGGDVPADVRGLPPIGLRPEGGPPPK